MGKKGSWFTALKKAFTSGSKDKPTNVQLVAQVPQHKNAKEKKRWGFGRSRQPEPELVPNPFIPLYREPSSIEKILGDAELERQHQYYSRAQYQIAPGKPNATAAAHDSKPVLPLPPPSPPALIRRFDHDREQQQLQLQQQVRQDRAETEWRQQPRTQPVHASRALVVSRPHAWRPRTVSPELARASAVRIQAAFRGYAARRNYRALRGLIRLQGVVRGHSVKRQTAHAMRCMQMLVRVQAQVRASRAEAMERRSRQQHGAMLRGDKDGGGSWRAGHQDDAWNDSTLTREEVDARTKRKVDAVIKRERALAYAYSHKLLKGTPMAAHAILADLQAGRNPWQWTPMDRHPEEVQASHFQPSKPKPVSAITDRETATPAQSILSSTSKPRPVRGPTPTKHNNNIRDDESLTSCPPFAVPNYMTPTASASAKTKTKARANMNQYQEKPHFSFGLGQGFGNWTKSPFWRDKSRSSRVGTPTSMIGRHRSTQSVSGLSVDSTMSLPVGIGRKVFK